METITSPHNPRIRQAVLLTEKARQRRDSGLFVIEGRRELALALRAGYAVETLFVCPQICGAPVDLPDCPKTFEVPPAVFAKLAYRSESGGVAAVARQKEHGLPALDLGISPFVLVIEGVEKPGNIGAILRTADAAGVSAVIVCSPLCDLYNPNVIRASIGTIFSVKTACCGAEEAFDFLTQNKIRILAAHPQAADCCYRTDMRTAAVVLGTEAEGLSPFWLARSDARIQIPMRGAADSLNVSAAAAVITFEAMRQRDSNIVFT